MAIDKKNHPQVYLEECKYKIKKIEMSRFINTELKSDSESDIDSDLEKMEAKTDNELEADSDNDSVYNTMHWFFLDDYWFFFLFFSDDYWFLLIIIDFYLWLFYDDWFFIDDYCWLFVIILFWYVSVVCINGGSGQHIFRKVLVKLMLLLWKLWMSSINSVKNCEYSILVKK